MFIDKYKTLLLKLITECKNFRKQFGASVFLKMPHKASVFTPKASSMTHQVHRFHHFKIEIKFKPLFIVSLLLYQSSSKRQVKTYFPQDKKSQNNNLWT